MKGIANSFSGIVPLVRGILLNCNPSTDLARLACAHASLTSGPSRLGSPLVSSFRQRPDWDRPFSVLALSANAHAPYTDGSLPHGLPGVLLLTFNGLGND